MFLINNYNKHVVNRGKKKRKEKCGKLISFSVMESTSHDSLMHIMALISYKFAK